MSNLKTPPIRLGISGDGQLGRMLAQACVPLDIEVTVYGKSPNSPAGKVVKHFMAADFLDPVAWEHFATTVDIVTPEWENVPLEMLDFLKDFIQVWPSPYCFKIFSHRLLEKWFAGSLGIATAPYLNVERSTNSDLIAPYLPVILKSCSGGYDGHNQTAIGTVEEFGLAIAKITDTHVVEKRMPFAYEISVIGVRSTLGEIALYPAVRNTHERGILRRTVFGEIPDNEPIPADVRRQAFEIVTAMLEKLRYVGVLAVEMFVMNDGRIIVNEMAPRVHNSGHWTIEGCKTSQFTNHVLAVCGRALQRIEPQCKGAIMENILGDEIIPYRKGEIRLGDNQFFHDYEKADVRPDRKMGHLTTLF